MNLIKSLINMIKKDNLDVTDNEKDDEKLESK